MTPDSADRDELKAAITEVDNIKADGTSSNRGEDWRHLRPLKHAEQLSGPAAPLRRLIESEVVSKAVKEREDPRNKAARGKKSTELLLRFRLFLLAAAVLVALWGTVSVTSLNIEGELRLAVAVWLALVSALLLDTVMPYLLRVNPWRRERGKAERLRGEIFEKLIGEAEKAGASLAPGEIKPELLALEYFRRFQLAAQIDYYSARIQQSETKIDTAKVLRHLVSGLFVLTLVVTALVNVHSYLEQGYLTWMPSSIVTGLDWLATSLADSALIAGLLVLGAIYLLFVFSSRYDYRSLYRMALAELSQALSVDLDKARAAATMGDLGPAKAMVARVHEAMRRENVVWLG